MDYEILLCNMNDEFICTLYSQNGERNYEALEAKYTAHNDFTSQLTFKVPLKYFHDDIELVSAGPQWQNSPIINERKVKLFYGAEKRQYEFIIKEITESTNGTEAICDVVCEDLAHVELNMQGTQLTQNLETLMLEWNKKPIAKKINFDFWATKIFAGTRWNYKVDMNHYGAPGRLPTKIYEKPRVKQWVKQGDDDNAVYIPIYETKLEERQALLDIKSTTTINHIMLLCEKFEVFAYFDYKYSTENPLRIVSRTVIFTNDPYKLSSPLYVAYGRNETSINRTISTKDLVTKMYIKPINTEHSENGLVDIRTAANNHSQENYIFNFDYCLSAKLMPQRHIAYLERFKNVMRTYNIGIRNSIKAASSWLNIITYYKGIIETAQTKKDSAQKRLDEAKKTQMEQRKAYGANSIHRKEMILAELDLQFGGYKLVTARNGALENTMSVRQKQPNGEFKYIPFTVRTYSEFDMFVTSVHIDANAPNFHPNMPVELFYRASVSPNADLNIRRFTTIIKANTIRITKYQKRLGNENDIINTPNPRKSQYANYNYYVKRSEILENNKKDSYNTFHKRFAPYIREGTWTPETTILPLLKKEDAVKPDYNYPEFMTQWFQLTDQDFYVAQPWSYINLPAANYYKSCIRVYRKQVGGTRGKLIATLRYRQGYQDFFFRKVHNSDGTQLEDILMINMSSRSYMDEDVEFFPISQIDPPNSLCDNFIYVYHTVEGDSVEIPLTFTRHMFPDGNLGNPFLYDEAKIYIPVYPLTEKDVLVDTIKFTAHGAAGLKNSGTNLNGSLHHLRNELCFIPNQNEQKFAFPINKIDFTYTYNNADDLIYDEAEKVESTSSMPNISYNIGIVDLRSPYNQDLNDATFYPEWPDNALLSYEGDGSGHGGYFNIINIKPEFVGRKIRTAFTIKNGANNLPRQWKLICGIEEQIITLAIGETEKNVVAIFENAANFVHLEPVGISYAATYSNLVVEALASPNVFMELSNTDYQQLNSNPFLLPGLRCFITDYDLNLEGVAGYITDITFDLNRPDQTSVTIQNFRAKFEDLFKRISATVTQVQTQKDTLRRTFDLLSGSAGTLNPNIVEKTINKASLNIGQNKATNKYTMTSKGLLYEAKDHVAAVLLNGSGIFFSNSRNDNGTYNFLHGITPDGISMDFISAGRIDTDKLIIRSSGRPNFTWTGEGLYAFHYETNSATERPTSFIRFNDDGLKFFNGFKSSVNLGSIAALDYANDEWYNDIMSLDWEGLRIGLQNNVLKLTSAKGLEVFDPDGKQRVQLGELLDVGADLYGLALKDRDGNLTLVTTSDGKLQLRDQILFMNDVVGINATSFMLYNDSPVRFWAGKTPNLGIETAKFVVTDNGSLFAQEVNIRGTAFLNSGAIGGFTITENNITAQNFLLHAPDINQPNWENEVTIKIGGVDKFFSVTAGGEATFAGVSVTGSVTATSGAFGGWLITENTFEKTFTRQLPNTTAVTSKMEFNSLIGEIVIKDLAPQEQINLRLSADGVLFARADAHVNGSIYSSSGIIGNWFIGGDIISSQNGLITLVSSDDEQSINLFERGTNNLMLKINGEDGSLFAEKANITGTINIKDGKILNKLKIGESIHIIGNNDPTIREGFYAGLSESRYALRRRKGLAELREAFNTEMYPYRDTIATHVYIDDYEHYATHDTFATVEESIRLIIQEAINRYNSLINLFLAECETMSDEDKVFGLLSITTDGVLRASSIYLTDELVANKANIFGQLSLGQQNKILLNGDAGIIQSGNFINNFSGWQINSNGNAEFNNVKIRGELSSVVFTHDQMNIQGGNLIVAPTRIVAQQINIIQGQTVYDVVFIDSDTAGLTEECDVRLGVYLPSNVVQDFEARLLVNGIQQQIEINAPAGSIIKADTHIVLVGLPGGGNISINAGDGKQNITNISIVENVITPTGVETKEKLKLGDLSNTLVNNMPLSGYGLYSENAYLTGEMIVTKGSFVGDINFDSTIIGEDIQIVGKNSSGASDYAKMWVGRRNPLNNDLSTSLNELADEVNFLLSNKGKLWANDVIINGQIAASELTVGGLANFARGFVIQNTLLIDNQTDAVNFYSPIIAPSISIESDVITSRIISTNAKINHLSSEFINFTPAYALVGNILFNEEGTSLLGTMRLFKDNEQIGLLSGEQLKIRKILLAQNNSLIKIVPNYWIMQKDENICKFSLEQNNIAMFMQGTTTVKSDNIQINTQTNFDGIAIGSSILHENVVLFGGSSTNKKGVIEYNNGALTIYFK